ncbi:MAG: GTP-binding protein [Mycoplasmataceae bacterium]|jgi:translation initiation factor IF-2|nr:GTP-binding protein [Mycoplasmataceae bacterium]
MINSANLVTFIGHVNHGKTTLLDYLFSSKKRDEEANGITQSNSVFYYEKNNEKIIFIDTPGHDDISISRNKMIGENICDFYVLVISAREGIKPSFLNVFKEVKKTKSQMLVFISFIDDENDVYRYEENIQKIKDDLFSIDIISDEYSTKGVANIDYVTFIYGSGKNGYNVEKLIDVISSNSKTSKTEKNYESLPDNFAVQINSMYDQKNKHLPRYSDIVMRKGSFFLKDSLITDNNFAQIEKIVNLSTNENVSSTDTLKPYRLFLKWQKDGYESSVFFQKIETEEEKNAIQSVLISYISELNERKIIDFGTREKINLSVYLKNSDIKNDLQTKLTSFNEKITDSAKYINLIKSSLSSVSEADIQNAFDEKSIILTYQITPPMSVQQKAIKLGVKLYITETIGEFNDTIENLLKSEKIKKKITTGEGIVLKVFGKTKEKKERIIGVRNTFGKMNSLDIVRIIDKNDQPKNIDLSIDYFAQKLPTETEFKKIAEISNNSEFTIIFKNFKNSEYDKYLKLIEKQKKLGLNDKKEEENIKKELEKIDLKKIIVEGDKIITEKFV